MKTELKIDFINYTIRDVIEHTDSGIKTVPEIEYKVKSHSVKAVVIKYTKTQNLQHPNEIEIAEEWFYMNSKYNLFIFYLVGKIYYRNNK